MTPRKLDQREDYADAMLTVQAACADDRASFFAEMTLLMAAWLTVRHAQGRPCLPLAAVPEPDDGESSPAGTLYRHAASLPGAAVPTIAESDKPDFYLAPRNARTTLYPAADPALDDLEAVIRGETESVSIPEGISTLIRLRSRCSKVSVRCTTHRLLAQELPDGSMTVTRVPRQCPLSHDQVCR